MSATSTLGITAVERITSANAAVADHELVRLVEFRAAESGTSPVGHHHVASDITDLDDAVKVVIGLYVADGDMIYWVTEGDPTVREARIHLKTLGGILADADGLYLNFGSGTGQVAAGNHSHPQLHDRLTKNDTDCIAVTLTGAGGQEFAATLLINEHDGASGLLRGVYGLSVNFGSGTGQVARGVDLEALRQEVESGGFGGSLGASSTWETNSGTGRVRLSTTPTTNRAVLGVDTQGLYVPLGTGANQAAAGDHLHSAATDSADGFLSAEDKRKLDAIQTLLQVDQSVSYSRYDFAPQGRYVGGRHRWAQSMEILRATLTAYAPSRNVRLDLVVDGDVLDSMIIPGGASGTEVVNAKDFAGLFVEADAYARWVVGSGTGIIQEEANHIDVSMNVQPALGSAPSIRINCGGPAVGSLWEADGHFDGGIALSSTFPVEIFGVTDPAPQAVYQSARARRDDATPINYTVSGLARGLQYKVRCHFGIVDELTELQQFFDVRVYGKTTVSELAYTPGTDPISELLEFTVKPDSTGTIRVEFRPAPPDFGDGLNAQVNGLEFLPVL